MRELKDYFCTYKQTQELMSLGLIGVNHLKHITPSNEILHQLSESCLGAPLRSQALDFFRDLGYWITPKLNNEHYYFEISKINRGGYAYSYKDLDYPKSESFLISKLIELEKEARNGN